ncbi:glycoside hydrolase family 3 C-terminal domain-containing protein [Pseudonocardia nematodicida]|uniref:Glycoside hydrolase family 3 C-terminal domain-containing protein n=1 Tax=Pseudonocardia nematodicida TaxID=1206997 RepID=A0ABV1KDY8_9PSEU
MTDPVCSPGTPFAAVVDAVRTGEQDLDQAVDSLVARMTDEQLLWLLDGDIPIGKGLPGMMERFRRVPHEGGRIDRLGIPGMRFTDGPRGVVLQRSTCFPVPVSRAATFDVGLEQAVGDAIGAEARAHGANLFGGICVNLAPIPGWGRSQESYGDDPLLLGEMGAALARGVHPWAMSTVKHFALNSMEEARFVLDVRVDEATLREVYLPHFRAVVEAGADSVMTAYNSVNGAWAGENRSLLADVLRRDWKFPGFVQTDWVWGLRHPVESVLAGQDLEMPFRQQRAAALPAALRDGRLTRSDIARPAARLLRAQVRFALRARATPALDVVASPRHRDLARTAAHRGSVLLRNESVAGSPLLPLDAAALGRVAVLGRLADQPNLGDNGSSAVTPPSTSSVLDGLRERLGDRVVRVDPTHPASPRPNDSYLGAAAAAAADADAAVVVVGFTRYDEGESLIALDADARQLMGGHLRFRPIAALSSALARLAGRRRPSRGGDRHDLHLKEDDVRLIRAVAAANPRTVVIVIAGGTVMPDPWDDDVAAILMAWYPGMEGGRAIADMLLGEAEPGGRLPAAIPLRREDLPTVDWHSRRVTYPRWWGQRKLDRDRVAAAYPFGFGLGYTSFEAGSVSIGPVDHDRFSAVVTLTNTGTRPGRHIVQVYATAADEDSRELVGFRPVQADPAEQVQVTVDCSLRPLQRWTGVGLRDPRGRVRIEAGSWWGDPAGVTAELEL